MKRESGILLHISSLDGKYGIGTLGEDSFRFIDFLEKTKTSIWQVLPLVTTSFGYSPYQSFSSFAGNHLLIDLEDLLNMGLIEVIDINVLCTTETSIVDFLNIESQKNQILRKAFHNFLSQKRYFTFFDAFKKENEFWLKDFSLFMAFKDYYGQAPLNQWDITILKRDKTTIDYYEQRFKHNIEYYQFVQYIFFKQWNKLKKYAELKGIKIMGDIPIYVAHDSVDVWLNPQLFQLDSELKPLYVAGVPPDYFSETGQLWGNPLYDWEANKLEDYKWWFSRIKFHFEMFDIIRIDHFRAFSQYWSIPIAEKTAINGKWEKALGYEFFKALELKYGKLQIVAEDLGIITTDVEDLRDYFSFPGMKILQFAFNKDPQNLYLPHNYNSNFVVYTGTHDNDTSLGWWNLLNEVERQEIIDYIGEKSTSIVWSLIRLAWSSVARIAIAPMQDFLELDTVGRMNKPGTCADNWKWKMKSSQLTDELAERILKINTIYNRNNSDC